MPRLSVYFVRASLIYLLIGFSIGGLMLANKGVMLAPVIWSLLPLHIEFAFVGWMIQLAMGVAFWILPRFRSGGPRGDERWSWLALLLLNAGICLVSVDTFLGTQGFTLVGRAMEILGLFTFVVGNWRRIKSFDT
jgi:hypothetical protein